MNVLGLPIPAGVGEGFQRAHTVLCQIRDSVGNLVFATDLSRRNWAVKVTAANDYLAAPLQLPFTARSVTVIVWDANPVTIRRSLETGGQFDMEIPLAGPGSYTIDCVTSQIDYKNGTSGSNATVSFVAFA